MTQPSTIGQPIADQLLEYKKAHEDEKEKGATTDDGTPVLNINNSLTVGKIGPVLLEDIDFFDIIQHFDRERIPERVVHAKGAGAFGYFEVTHDISQYTAAKVFNGIGKKTRIAVRFSQVTFEMGSQDTTRDVRGFAVKFYTEDGNWDLVGNNTPIFFIQDGKSFPQLIHILKRNPVTHVRDWNMFWDFFSLRPESMHQVLIFYSDRGIPNGYRRMNGYGSNTFSLINKQGDLVFCKFHYLTNQGISNLQTAEATIIAGQDPDYALRDLYNSIALKLYPSWNFYIQVMTQEQVAASDFNPFDVTKVWPHAKYPLIPVGKLVLNQNPSNYFAEIEQLSFNPATFIPGISASPDKVLQGRLMSYSDTSRYRLGVNYLQIPVNSPKQFSNYNRDGSFTIHSQGGAPNYYPNSFGGPEIEKKARHLYPSTILNAKTGFYEWNEDDNFSQPRIFYRNVLNEDEKERLAMNIANDLRNAWPFIQERQLENFRKVDENLEQKVRSYLPPKPTPEIDV